MKIYNTGVFYILMRLYFRDSLEIRNPVFVMYLKF